MLDGRGGDDFLLGSTGGDTLIGGAGTDVLQGGFGSDVYIFADATHHTAAEINDIGFDGDLDIVRFTATTASTLTMFAGDQGIDKIILGDPTLGDGGTIALNVDASALSKGDQHHRQRRRENVITGTAFAEMLEGNGGDDS